MKPFKTQAHIHSLDGQMDEISNRQTSLLLLFRISSIALSLVLFLLPFQNVLKKLLGDRFQNRLGDLCVIGRPVDLDYIFRCRFPFHFVAPFNPKVLIMDFITSASFPSREGKSLSNNSCCSSLR